MLHGASRDGKFYSLETDVSLSFKFRKAQGNVNFRIFIPLQSEETCVLLT